MACSASLGAVCTLLTAPCFFRFQSAWIPLSIIRLYSAQSLSTILCASRAPGRLLRSGSQLQRGRRLSQSPESSPLTHEKLTGRRWGTMSRLMHACGQTRSFVMFGSLLLLLTLAQQSRPNKPCQSWNHAPWSCFIAWQGPSWKEADRWTLPRSGLGLKVNVSQGQLLNRIWVPSKSFAALRTLTRSRGTGFSTLFSYHVLTNPTCHASINVVINVVHCVDCMTYHQANL